MKKIILFILCSLTLIYVQGQNTWTHALSLNWNNDVIYNQYDSICGIVSVADLSNGNIAFISKNTHDAGELYLLSNDNLIPIDWYETVELNFEFLAGLKPTNDSGFIYINQWYNLLDTYESNSQVIKCDKYGNVQWHVDFSNVFYIFPEHGYEYISDCDISPSVTDSTYFVLFPDTLYQLNSNGNVINTLQLPFSCDRVEALPNNDVLIFGTNKLARINPITGNIIWQDTVNHYYFKNNYLYVMQTSTISRIDIGTGAIIYSFANSFPNTLTIEVKSNGELLVGHDRQPAQLSDLDSLGNLIWTRQYSMPYYGLNEIKELSNGEIITGGSWLSSGYELQMTDRSSFICSLQSDGHGTLDSTNTYWPMDANHNHIVGFLDDILNVALAQGDSGSTDAYTEAFMNHDFEYSTFGTDWSGRFGNGLNHKYADCNGDGIINARDFQYFTGNQNVYFSQFSYDPLIRINHSPDSIPPFIYLLPENNSVHAGDTLTYDIILGTSLARVDSIFGFAFQTNFNSTFIDTSSTQMIISNTGFGDSTNLLLVKDILYGIPTPNYDNVPLLFMLARNNPSDYHDLFDTVAKIKFVTIDTISTNPVFDFTNFQVHAIDAYGNDVSLTPVTGGVIISPRLTGIDEIDKNSVMIYPDPVNNYFTINSLLKNNFDVVIYNVLGKKNKEIHSLSSGEKIDCSDLSPGIYFVNILSGNQKIIRRIEVSR